jgi:hypothetical protein
MQGESGYGVVTDALTNHARTLSGLADELRAVQDLMAGVSMTAEAYGEIGPRAASAIDALGQVGQDAMREGVAALESAAGELRASVVSYAQEEADGVDVYTRMDDVLDRLPETPAVEGWS